MDEIFRAIFGLLWAWPGIACGQRRKWKSLTVTVLVTIWMIPGWWLYNQLMMWVL